MNYKKGDVVATVTGFYVMIIKDQIESNCATVYAICDTEEVYLNCYRGWFSRLATEEEKDMLFQLLYKEGYSWDEENLQLIQEL